MLAQCFDKEMQMIPLRTKVVQLSILSSVLEFVKIKSWLFLRSVIKRPRDSSMGNTSRQTSTKNGQTDTTSGQTSTKSG